MPLSGCAPASKPSQAADAAKPVAKAVSTCTGNGCCSGLGMSAQPNVDEFVKDFKQLQSDWPKLTGDEREQRLETLANKQLSKSGVPKVGVVPETLPKGNGGHLDFKNWQLAVNKDQRQHHQRGSRCSWTALLLRWLHLLLRWLHRTDE